MPQRHSLLESFSLTAEGVRSGRQVTVTVAPAPAGSGLVLTATETGAVWPLDLAHTLALPGCTAAGTAQSHVAYIEHFLAACSALSLTDAAICVVGPELPLLDGSAQPWLERLLAAGLQEFSVEVAPLIVTEPVIVGRRGAQLTALPAPETRLAFTLESPHPLIGRQTATYRPGTDDFATLVAPARTFTTVEEATYAREHGLMRGGSEENAIVIYPDHLSAEPQLEQAFAYHKLLDLTGDLYVLGRPVQARISGFNSGHTLNHLFAEALARHAETGEAVLDEEAP